MALSGIEIVKLLPRINCQECGFTRCLAFAMKLAEDEASPDWCHRLSDEARAILAQECPPDPKMPEQVCA